jgi:hypothetical protein
MECGSGQTKQTLIRCVVTFVGLGHSGLKIVLSGMKCSTLDRQYLSHPPDARRRRVAPRRAFACSPAAPRRSEMPLPFRCGAAFKS